MQIKFSKIFNELFKKSALKDVGILSFGTALAQSIIIFSSPIITRIYSPSQYGEFVTFLAFSNILAVIFTLKFETSIFVPKYIKEARNVLMLCIFLIFSFFIFYLFLTLIFDRQILRLFKIENFEFFLIFSLILGAFLSVNNVSQFFLNRLKNFKMMAVLRISQSILVTFTAVVFGLFVYPQHGLIYSQLFSLGIIALFLMFFLDLNKIKFRWKILKDSFISHLNAPKFIFPTALIDIVTLQLPIILSVLLFTKDLSGQFGLAWKVTIMPIILIGAAISQVFMQRLLTARSKRKFALNLLLRTWTALFLFSLPLWLLFFYGETIFSVIFGETWSEAGKIASIITPMMIFLFIASPTSSVFILLNIQRYSLYYGLLVLVFRSVSFYVGFIYDNFYIALYLWVILEIIAICLYSFIVFKKINQIAE